MDSGPSADAGTIGSTMTIADTGMTVRMATAASTGIPTGIAMAVGRMETVHVVTSMPMGMAGTGMAGTGIVIMTTTAVGRDMANVVPDVATSGMTVTMIVGRASVATVAGMTTVGLIVGKMSGLAGIAHGTTTPVMIAHARSAHMEIVTTATVPMATVPMATVPVMTIIKAAIGVTVPMATSTKASMVVMIVAVKIIAMTTAAGLISVTTRMAMTAVAATQTGPFPTHRRTPTRIVGLESPRCPRAWSGPCSPRMIACACAD